MYLDNQAAIEYARVRFSFLRIIEDFVSLILFYILMYSMRLLWYVFQRLRSRFWPTDSHQVVENESSHLPPVYSSHLPHFSRTLPSSSRHSGAETVEERTYENLTPREVYTLRQLR